MTKTKEWKLNDFLKTYFKFENILKFVTWTLEVKINQISFSVHQNWSNTFKSTQMKRRKKRKTDEANKIKLTS